MNDFIQTLSQKQGDLWIAMIEHIQISLLSLLIAMIIAIPLAIFVTNKKKTGYVLTQVANVFQTIPSLALLGLLIPFVGIGTVPAIIALVVYAILPIFQNTYVGLRSIDPYLQEAANAFGMNKFEKLTKVQIPLALPTIVSGIRQALVMIIGTATLAALIGAGGLGTFILLGINRNDNTITLIGAIASALLAIIFSSLIYLLQKVKLRYSIFALLVIILIPVGTQAYQSLKPTPTMVTIAGKLGSEPDILINMYKELIKQDDPKAQVTLKSNFGQTSFLFNALKTNQIDVYPEFTGTVLDSLVKVPSYQKQNNLSATKLYAYAKLDLKQQFDLDYLKPMAYNNTYAVVVSQKFAKENNVKTISDLSKVQDKINAGFDLEFLNRNDGYLGIKKRYNIRFKTSSMDPSLRYQALDKGKINLTDGYSTDSQIRQYNLVALEDDKKLFPTYQGAPLLSQKFADENPKVVKSINKLAGKITEKQMQEMNYEVNVKKISPAKVAHNYLKQQKMIVEDK